MNKGVCAYCGEVESLGPRDECDKCEKNYNKFSEVMKGYDEVLAEEDIKMFEVAPTCHFTKMIYETNDTDYGPDQAWWECQHCGHTKDI